MNRTSQSLQESVPSKQHALLLPTQRELMCALSLYYGRPSYIQATAGTGSASSACFWAPLQDSATHRERNKTPLDVLRFKLALPSPKYTSFVFCLVGAWVAGRWMTHSTRNMDVDVQAR